MLIDGNFVLTESTLICLYLAEKAPANQLVPTQTTARWDVLRRTALTDTLIEATVAIVVETLRRPKPLQSSDWIDRQYLKIRLSLERLTADTLCDADHPDLAGVSLACALGYLDLRRPDIAWRDRHPHHWPGR